MSSTNAPRALAAALTLALAAGAASCHDRCVNAGHCCVGNISSCANPSCDMGCMMGSVSASEAACNATCAAASGKCSISVPPFNFQMCGGCANKWLDPTTLQPEIIPGQPPYWPPGYQIQGCTTCDDVHDECMLGCVLQFNPSFAPGPPVDPPSPPDVPEPPAPWPSANGTGFNFSVVFSDHIVLQQAPAMAAVYGQTGGAAGADAVVSVTVTPSAGGGAPYTVPATVTAGRWKALLQPTPDSSRNVTFAITASCSSGCSGAASVTLSDVAFGDVWFCAGQSNMVKNFLVTYGLDNSLWAIESGQYDNIRLMSGTSEVNGIYPPLPPTHPWRTVKDAAQLPQQDADSWFQFSAACYHFAEAVTDQHVLANRSAPTLGLVSTAIGGSMIEEWITDAAAQQCYGYAHSANGDHNHLTWDHCVVPFLDMTIKGALYYQGENNAGSLHGNSAVKAGYSCMMPRLVALWRERWSATPGTTEADFPFGLVTLTPNGGEGSSDLGSFRFAQVGSWGTLPNPDMPRTWVAHGYDLSDPWVFCEDQNPATKECPGCDSADPLYNCLAPNEGPQIHSRLKKPVGQRLAAGALVTAYGFAGPVAGPTISGCTLAGAPSSASLTVTFAVAGGPMFVKPYGGTAFSGFSALVGATDAPETGRWVALNISQVGATSAVSVDLAPLGGQAPQAIKYAWGPTGDTPNGGDVMCCELTGAKECLPAQCPIFVATDLAPYGGLPANPFLAQITAGGKCLCPTPQTCDL